MAVRARSKISAVAALLLVGAAGCGSGPYLLPPHAGGTATARAYQQAVEDHYRATESNLSSAVTAEELAIAHDPKWAPAYARLATLFVALGSPDAGITVAKKAASLSPRSALYQTNLGELAQKVGRNRLAESAYQRGLALNPADWEAMDGLAALAAIQLRFDQAEVLLSRAVVAGGPEALTWQTFGAMAQAEGKLGLAARYYRDAVGADGSWWEPHYDLAKLAILAGRPRDAGDQLRVALNDNPGSSQAWLLLETLPAELKRWRQRESGQYPVSGSTIG